MKTLSGFLLIFSLLYSNFLLAQQAVGSLKYYLATFPEEQRQSKLLKLVLQHQAKPKNVIKYTGEAFLLMHSLRPKTHALLLIYRGKAFIKLGKFDEAEAAAEQSYHIAKQHDLQKQIFLARHLFGSIHLRIGKFDQAEVFFKEAQVIAQKLNENVLIRFSY